jgi:hypothetical protein
LPGRVAEVIAVSALAAIVTVTIAAPVLRAPSERVFGMEIVGRHHDPFTVMEQFGRPIRIGVYSQPVTDVTGALLARVSGAVAAYNWLILLSFPLSAASAYLLARHLALSPAGATVAAMAYAFSPFHIAHAAYHPHVAQIQWMPLYFLALWRCLDAATPAAMGLLGAATMAVTLSNFYAGVIAAVTTPVAVAAYWFFIRRDGARSMRRLLITIGTLLIVAGLGMAYAWHGASLVVMNPTNFAFPRADLYRYSAKWWSYLVPPVGNPLLGATAHRIWAAAGVHEGLLEQQVSLGGGIVALGLVGIGAWLTYDRQRAPFGCVPVLVLAAVAALVCSLSPDRTIGGFTFYRPSALLYHLVPMFRSYARFGVVVQLMAALLAGMGVDYLRRAETRRARILCLLLVTVAAGEYAVAPQTLWRDVLPTDAHRWVMRQAGRVRACDCMPLDQESQSIRWLTGDRVTLGTSTSDCTEPNLPDKLAATGYTHLLVRRDTPDGQWFAQHAALDGLRVAATFSNGQVFAVTAPTPAIYTAAMTAFFPREHDAEWSWRWMGADASWTIVNTRARPIVATLSLEMSAFHHTRRMELFLDGRLVQSLDIQPLRRIYRWGPLTVTPGDHELMFCPSEVPTIASHVIDNGDRRPLSSAIGTWEWAATGERP